jgi:Mrp family chromosome partitioning ATPase
LPRFTKPYWVDWENQATRDTEGWPTDDQGQPQPAPGGTYTGRMPAPGARRNTIPRHRSTPAEGPQQAPQQGEEAPAEKSASGSGSITSERRVVDPSRTIIDQLAPVPARVRFSTAKPPVDAQGAAQGPQEKGDVADGEQNKLQVRQPPAQQQGMVVRQRPDAPVSRNLPTVDVATHELEGEHLSDDRLVLLREPDSERAAAFRVLRHQIVRQNDPQVIVVSSALPGEGKTTTAVNLALALSEAGRSRTLLVEANFTNPCLSAVFRFKPPWCFAQQVSEHRQWADKGWSVVEVRPHGLHVAAVDLRTERKVLLDAPAFAFALEQMRMAGYDYIVVDAPHVIGSAEVNLLQDGADGVLLVTRGGKSRRKELRKCIEQLAPETVLGVTLLQ